MNDVDRITPYEDGGGVEKRIDEIVALAEVKQLREALEQADKNTAKLEALLEPHIKWDAITGLTGGKK